jgi:hypothetical protein
MRYLSLILIALLLTVSSYAQSLHFTTTSYPEDTFLLHAPDTLTLTNSIYNSSGTPFTGTVSVHALVRDSVDLSSAIDTPFLQSATIDSGGTPVPCTIQIHTSNPLFEIGPNVVVIWPVYQGGAAGPNDSIHLIVYIDTTYIDGINGSALLKTYVYQTGNYLHISFGEAQNLIQQVRIYDVDGQLMYDNTPAMSQSIYAAGWQKGIYLCEISTQAGERRVFKVVVGD